MTVLDGLDPMDDPSCLRNERRLFARAEFCNMLAKLATGRTRDRLYVLKNSCLHLMRTRFPNGTETHVDQDRYWGLLSIGLKGSKRRGLHSHEAWLPAA